MDFVSLRAIVGQNWSNDIAAATFFVARKQILLLPKRLRMHSKDRKKDTWKFSITEKMVRSEVQQIRFFNTGIMAYNVACAEKSVRPAWAWKTYNEISRAAERQIYVYFGCVQLLIRNGTLSRSSGNTALVFIVKSAINISWRTGKTRI